MDGYALPYCGAAPVPGAVAWNSDPVLIACLTFAALAHIWYIRRFDQWRQVAAVAGWLVVGLALVSPLCSFSVALFSARVGQHMIIALLVAPLVAFGLPRRVIASGEIWLAVTAFGLALWFWHLPGPYDLTFASTAIYWIMHLTTFGASIWLWSVLLSPSCNLWTALTGSFFTAMHMSLLGALLTFSPKPLFAVHMLSTAAWGLTPLEDQQLGGLIMWIPTGLLLVAYAVVAFGLELRRLEQAAATDRTF